MIAVYTEPCIQSQFSGFCVIVHLIFGPVNGTMRVEGLSIKCKHHVLLIITTLTMVSCSQYYNIE